MSKIKGAVKMAEKKIRFALEITIDPQAWADEYGVAVSEVKEDMFSYIADQIPQLNGFTATGAQVSVKKRSA